MAFEDNIEQEITGKTLDECRRKLFRLYGTDYRIVDKYTDWKYGFLGINKKAVQVVKYVVNHHNAYTEKQVDRISEEELLEKNRRAIIEKQNEIMLKGQINQLTKKLDELQTGISAKLDNLPLGKQEKHESIKKIEELLEQNEFSFSYIQMIEDKINSEFSINQLDDFSLIERYVVDWIGESITIAPERTFRPPHVVIIVGPTGVGKTTTIAKLASNTILDAKANHQPRPELCILTIDTMRVGALEQLSKFGEILGKNVLKAETSDDVLEIYNEYKEHVDYIFIDTSGYSPNDSTHIAEMKNILNVENMRQDIYLSICASTKASDLANIFRNFEPFGYESVIVTKCDETKQFGNIISVLYDKHKSISYITDGQHVPRNIKRANKIDILKSLSGFNIDRVHIEDKFGEK